MSRTLEQKIAEAESKLNRLKAKNRAQVTGQKIILGGILLNGALNEPKIRGWLIAEAYRVVTREADMKRLEPLLNHLEKIHQDLDN